jgi:hypothetical protein
MLGAKEGRERVVFEKSSNVGMSLAVSLPVFLRRRWAAQGAAKPAEIARQAPSDERLPTDWCNLT